MRAGNAAFSHRKVVFESKIARKMLCFTIETAAGGCGGRRGVRAGMGGYRRIGPPLGSESIGCESHCKAGVKVTLGGRLAALC